MLTLWRLTVRLFFQLFVSISSWDVASTSAFCFWLPKYLLIASRGKHKENVKQGPDYWSKYSLRSPFQFTETYSSVQICHDRKFWNFKTTNELVIVLHGSLTLQYFTPLPLNILRKSIIPPLFKCSTIEVVASRRCQYF